MDQELISQTALDQMVSSDQTQLINSRSLSPAFCTADHFSLCEIGGIVQHNGAVLSRTH